MNLFKIIMPFNETAYILAVKYTFSNENTRSKLLNELKNLDFLKKSISYRLDICNLCAQKDFQYIELCGLTSILSSFLAPEMYFYRIST